MDSSDIVKTCRLQVRKNREKGLRLLPGLLIWSWWQNQVGNEGIMIRPWNFCLFELANFEICVGKDIIYAKCWRKRGEGSANTETCSQERVVSRTPDC